MKPLFRLSLFLIIAVGLFSSCKKATSKHIKFIPKEASLVATLNSKSVQDKLVKSQVNLDNLFKTITGASDSSVEKGKKEWESLKNSGIDLDENIYFSVTQKGGGMSMGSGTAVTSVVAGLKNAEKFETYLKEKDSAAQVQKEKDYSYSVTKNTMVAWGKDVIIAMTYNKAPVGMDYDTTTNTFKQKPEDANSTVDIKAEMASLFNLKEDASMASIDEFEDLVAQKSDGSLWVNSASSVSEMPLPLPKLQTLLENSYTAATIDFEDGQIVMNSKTYSSKAMAEILEKNTGSVVNLDMIKNYPSNNIAGFFVTSFNPEFFNSIVKYLEVGGMVDGFLTNTMGTNYTLQDALKAIKGEVAVVVSDIDLSKVNKSNTVQSGPSAMSGTTKILFNAAIGDKVQFDRLMNKLVEQQMLVKLNNEYRVSPKLQSMGYSVSIDDKNLLIASDSSVISQYKTGNAKANIDAGLLDAFKGKSSAGFIDLEKIMNTVVADSSNAESLTAAKSTFKNVRGYTDNYNGKHIEGRIEINFKNDKENSLASLLKFLAASSKNFNKTVDGSSPVNIDSAIVEE